MTNFIWDVDMSHNHRTLAKQEYRQAVSQFRSCVLRRLRFKIHNVTAAFRRRRQIWFEKWILKSQRNKGSNSWIPLGPTYPRTNCPMVTIFQTGNGARDKQPMLKCQSTNSTDQQTVFDGRPLNWDIATFYAFHDTPENTGSFSLRATMLWMTKEKKSSPAVVREL